MIRNIIFSLLAILLAFAVIGILALVGAAVVFGSAWLLLFVAPLTFFHASLLTSTVMFALIFVTQRELDVDFLSMMIRVVIFVPIVSFILNGVTWMVNCFISLSYEETLLIITFATLPILYDPYVFISQDIENSSDEDDEDDEYDEDEDEYDYYEDEEEEDLTPKIRIRKKKSSQYTPEDILEELKKASQKANEPCYCGSGKKYRRCHGRKSWR